MGEILIWIGGALIVGGIAVYRGWRRSLRTPTMMWDSQVAAWVSEGLSRGYVIDAGKHTAYDDRTPVQTLVVQTSAVKRLRSLTERGTYER